MSEVQVRNNDIEQAIRRLKRAVQADGTVRRFKERAQGLYRKPCCKETQTKESGVKEKEREKA